MANQFTPWSDIELSQLRELAGKFPATHISDKIGRGYDAVSKMIRKLGLPSYVPKPVKPRPIAHRKPSTVPEWANTAPTKPKSAVSPLKPSTVRKASVTHISYPPLEWCPTCHSPVSNWEDHRRRIGCERPA